MLLTIAEFLTHLICLINTFYRKMHVKDTFVTNVPLCPLAPNPNGCYTSLYPIPIGYPGRSTYSSCGSRCPIPVVLSKRAKPKEIHSSAFYFLCTPMKREETVAEMEMRGQWDLFIHPNLRLTCIYGQKHKTYRLKDANVALPGWY